MVSHLINIIITQNIIISQESYGDELNLNRFYGRSPFLIEKSNDKYADKQLHISRKYSGNYYSRNINFFFISFFVDEEDILRFYY